MRASITKWQIPALGLAFLLASIAGCSGEEEAETDIYGSPEDMNRLSDDQLNIVNVGLVEFAIELPETLPPGPTKFVVTNKGESKHNFQIDGPGMERVLAQEELKPGETGELRVDLKPGKYVVYCPVFNNRDRGMLRNLTVTPNR